MIFLSPLPPGTVKELMKVQLLCYQYIAYDCMASVMWVNNAEYATWRGPHLNTLTQCKCTSARRITLVQQETKCSVRFVFTRATTVDVSGVTILTVAIESVENNSILGEENCPRSAGA